MTKSKRLLCFILSIMFCFFGGTITAQADDSEIMPLYDYTQLTSANLHISGSKATVSINCTGISGQVTKITAETCLQRKVGIIWVKADIGTTDNVWTDSTTKDMLNASHSATLSKTGTYRAKVIFKVYNGSDYEKITMYSGTATY